MVKLLRVALPVEQLRCRRIILRRPQSTCVRLELHCMQPLHRPEIQRLLLLAVSAESGPFQQHLRRTGLSARQAEMTASRQVDGVCPGVKAEFCLRPLLALRRKLAHPVPQLKQKARPVFRLVKRLPGRLDMKRPQHLLKRHPAPLSGADDCSQQFFQQNRFVSGGAKIGAREVHLGLVEMPVLNIFAEQDHLVPPDASRALKDLAGTRDYTELSFKGGHIGIYVSGRAQKEVPDTIHHWLAKRSH